MRKLLDVKQKQAIASWYQDREPDVTRQITQPVGERLSEGFLLLQQAEDENDD